MGPELMRFVVFDPAQVPKNKGDFLDWYKQFSRFERGKWDFECSERTPPALCAWFDAIRQTYPPLNGPLAPEVEDGLDLGSTELPMADYYICADGIEASFSPGYGRQALPLVRELAQKHGLGFYDQSGSGQVLLPSGRDMPDAPAKGLFHKLFRF